jgi:hypothetical protein
MTEVDHGRRRLLAGLGGMTLTATTCTVAASAADHAPTSLRNTTAIVRVIGVAGYGGGGSGTQPPPDGAVGTLRYPSSDPDAIVWMLQSDYLNHFTDPVNHEHYGFRNVRHLCTRGGYCPPGQFLLDGYFDHSEAGINHAARKLADRADFVWKNQGARITNINIEQYRSRNVPSPLTDGTNFGDGQYDDQRANTDYFTERAGIRRECHRFRFEIAKRALAILKGRGLGFIEFWDYNLPRKYNNGVFASPTHSGIVFEAKEFKPYFDLISAFGPQAGQNWSFPSLQDHIRAGSTSARNSLINEQIGQIHDRVQACANQGYRFRACAWPWPMMWANGDPNYQKIPVPTGYMTQMLDGFYAAGVRRFFSFIWRHSRNLMTTAERNQAVANLEEAAAWIQAKANASKVVVIGNSFA